MEVGLREFRTADAPVMAELYDDEGIARFVRDSFPRPYRLEHAEEYISRTLEGEADRQWHRVILVDGAFAGNIVARRGQDVYRMGAEIGYSLGAPFRGRGVATRALRMFCDMLFDTTDLVRLAAEVFGPNMASCRVLEKCGFRLEGTFRRCVCREGELWDAHHYALLRETGKGMHHE